MNKETKKFKLNVAIRLMLLMNFPEQGNIVDMISKRNIRKKIEFSSEEVDEYNIANKDGKITWNTESPSIEVEFTNSEIEFLKTLIDKLDKSGLITDNILDFVEEILNE